MIHCRVPSARRCVVLSGQLLRKLATVNHNKQRPRPAARPAKRSENGPENLPVMGLSGLIDAHRGRARASPNTYGCGSSTSIARMLSDATLTARVAAASEAAQEHENIRFAREAIARMVGPKSKVDTLTYSTTMPAARQRTIGAAPIAHRGPQLGKAFGVGLAGGAVIAVVAGLFGTGMLMEPLETTAAPHHPTPSSSGFAFTLANSTDVHDGGLAWAWRAAVTLRTIHDISVQRADTGSSLAMRAQLASRSRAGAAYPVMPPVGQRTAPGVAAGQQPLHTISVVEVLGKFETETLPASNNAPPTLAVATAEPRGEMRGKAALPVDPAPVPIAVTPAKAVPFASAAMSAPTVPPTRRALPVSGREVNAGHHATPRPERAVASEPAAAPRVRTARHVQNKVVPSPQRPSKLIANNDDDERDTASASAPSSGASNNRSAETRGSVPKRAMRLGTGSRPAAAAGPNRTAEAPKGEWYKAPLPSWSPFQNAATN